VSGLGYAPCLMLDQRPWVFGIVFGALGCGVVLGAVSIFLVSVLLENVTLKQGVQRLLHPAPGPKWTFSSWATNLTATGAVLGTVLAGATLPKTPRPLDTDTLKALNLFFGLLVVAGPFVFQCIRNPKVSATDPDDGRWGWNIGLLVGCCLTIAATVGEFTTLAVVYWILLGGGGWGWVAVLIAVLAGAGAAYYFLVTVPYLIGSEWKTNAQHRQSRAQALQAAFIGAPPQQPVVTVVPDVAPVGHWSLL
jgi:hypothetical protein